MLKKLHYFYGRASLKATPSKKAATLEQQVVSGFYFTGFERISKVGTMMSEAANILGISLEILKDIPTMSEAAPQISPPPQKILKAGTDRAFARYYIRFTL